jgi:hypothetical protein
MEWMALAWLIAFQATKMETYKQAAITLWKTLYKTYEVGDMVGIMMQQLALLESKKETQRYRQYS